MTDSGLSTPRSRTWGIIGTVLFHAVLLGLMALMVLDYNNRREKMLHELQQELPEEQEDDETILKPGEYVEVGDDFYEPAAAPVETAPASAEAKPAAGSDNIIAGTTTSAIKVPARRDSVRAEARRRASERRAEQERAAQAKAIGERVQFGTAATGTPRRASPAAWTATSHPAAVLYRASPEPMSRGAPSLRGHPRRPQHQAPSQSP